MSILKNEKVIHKQYGEGKIVEVNEEYFNVQFIKCEGTKKFKYPDSFEKFMTFKKSELQEEAKKYLSMDNIEKRIKEELKRKETEALDTERREERMDKMKKQRKATRAKSTRMVKKIIEAKEEAKEAREEANNDN